MENGTEQKSTRLADYLTNDECRQIAEGIFNVGLYPTDKHIPEHPVIGSIVRQVFKRAIDSATEQTPEKALDMFVLAIGQGIDDDSLKKLGVYIGNPRLELQIITPDICLKGIRLAASMGNKEALDKLYQWYVMSELKQYNEYDQYKQDPERFDKQFKTKQEKLMQILNKQSNGIEYHIDELEKQNIEYLNGAAESFGRISAIAKEIDLKEQSEKFRRLHIQFKGLYTIYQICVLSSDNSKKIEELSSLIELAGGLIKLINEYHTE